MKKTLQTNIEGMVHVTLGCVRPTQFRVIRITHRSEWPDLRRLQSLAMNISGTDEDIRSRSSTRLTAIPPALGEKSAVNFGSPIPEI